MKQKQVRKGNQRRSIERKVRLTPEEYALFVTKAERYHTMAAMIRDAVRLFDDVTTKRKIEAMTEIKQYYVRFDQRLGWMGSNLNQAQHRANELAIDGRLSSEYVQQILEPQVRESIKLIREMKQQLEELRRKLLKL